MDRSKIIEEEEEEEEEEEVEVVEEEREINVVELKEKLNQSPKQHHKSIWSAIPLRSFFDFTFFDKVYYSISNITKLSSRNSCQMA